MLDAKDDEDMFFLTLRKQFHEELFQRTRSRPDGGHGWKTNAVVRNTGHWWSAATSRSQVIFIGIARTLHLSRISLPITTFTVCSYTRTRLDCFNAFIYFCFKVPALPKNTDRIKNPRMIAQYSINWLSHASIIRRRIVKTNNFTVCPLYVIAPSKSTKYVLRRKCTLNFTKEY